MRRLLTKATRQHTRDHNSLLVLRTIYDRGLVSRADLARLTKLTRTTVSDVVSRLMARGLVAEVGPGASTGGRTPVLLSIVDDSRHLIAINLRSTHVAGAAINLRGDIRRRGRRPIASRDAESVLALIYELVDELVAQATSPLLGIGISTPGLIDGAAGIVRRAVNFGWHDLPLGDLLTSRYRLPIYVGNDAHMAALAEYTFGESRACQNVAVVHAGQGIGAGLIINGRMYYGSSHGAGEIGHIVVVEGGRPCKCGNRGCLETVASSDHIVERARALAAAGESPALTDADGGIDLDAVARACAAGDPAVLALVAEVGGHFGAAAANLVGILNVERIVITGPVARFGQPLREAVAAAVARRSLPALAQATEVVVAGENPDTVLLGLSALLLNDELPASQAEPRASVAS